LGAKDHEEAKILLNAKNESFRQPILNLQIAKEYLSGSDNGIATRTWQQAIDSLIVTKQAENQNAGAPRPRFGHESGAATKLPFRCGKTISRMQPSATDWTSKRAPRRKFSA
jgi:hypothetical protein